MRDLPDDLELPLASGAAWWYWLGGRPALDLVNTRRERWRRCVETLVGPRDLARWLVEAGLLETAPARPSRRALDGARELREAIDAAVVAVVAGEPAPPAAVGVIDAWLPRPSLALDADGVPVLREGDGLRDALAVIALDAATMLGTAERTRIRICDSETCSARFYDRSPGGRRRWCSMRACGNVNKVRRHRAHAQRDTERSLR